MLEFRYDTQLLIEGHDLDEEQIRAHFLARYFDTAFLNNRL